MVKPHDQDKHQALKYSVSAKDCTYKPTQNLICTLHGSSISTIKLLRVQQNLNKRKN